MMQISGGITALVTLAHLKSVDFAVVLWDLGQPTWTPRAAFDTKRSSLHRSHELAQVPDSEVLTVAVVAAKYFQNHHERALCVLREAHYLSGRLDLSRFNRRLRAFHEIFPHQEMCYTRQRTTDRHMRALEQDGGAAIWAIRVGVCRDVAPLL